jgi:hypothetical protein
MPAISAPAVIDTTSPPTVQRRMKSAALLGQRDASGLGLVLPLGCRPATRRPTATATATRVNGGGRRRAAALEAPGSKTPANGSELRKQSLKTGVTGPRGPETALVVPFTRASARRGHVGVTFVRCGVLAKLGSGPEPPDPYSTEARPRTAGRAVWCWLLGLQRPHVGGLGALRARRHVELDDLPFIK